MIKNRKLTLERRIARLERMLNRKSVKNEDVDSEDTIELAGYSWTRIGEIDGYDLYLCDSIVKRMPFSDKPTNDYEESSVRKWLLGSFYSKFSRIERAGLAKTNNDPVFVLGDAHIIRNENNIPRVNGEWFTATPVFDTDDMIEYVTADNEVYVGKDFDEVCGVRPAILLA